MHLTQPQDVEEEARLPTLVAVWKKKHPKKAKAGVDVNSMDDDDVEDKGAGWVLLRGHPKAGWRMASISFY